MRPQLTTTRFIRTTYAIITPESAEQGDYEETGWENEEGVTMQPDQWDLEEGKAAVDLAVEFLRDQGAFHASSSHFHPGLWYSAMEEDYRTGATTERSFHLAGFTEEEERAVFEEVNR